MPSPRRQMRVLKEQLNGQTYACSRYETGKPICEAQGEQTGRTDRAGPSNCGQRRHAKPLPRVTTDLPQATTSGERASTLLPRRGLQLSRSSKSLWTSGNGYV